VTVRHYSPLRHFSPDTSQPSSPQSRVYRAASQHAVTQDLTLSISHIITSDRRSDAIIIGRRIVVVRVVVVEKTDDCGFCKIRERV